MEYNFIVFKLHEAKWSKFNFISGLAHPRWNNEEIINVVIFIEENKMETIRMQILPISERWYSIFLVIPCSQHPSAKWGVRPGARSYTAGSEVPWRQNPAHTGRGRGGVTFFAGSTPPHISAHLFQATAFCSMPARIPKNNFLLSWESLPKPTISRG